MLSKETGIMILPISIVYFFITMKKNDGHVAKRGKEADCNYWAHKYKGFLIPVIAVSEPSTNGPLYVKYITVILYLI